MSFLPILERELRLRARSRANYWGRFGVGLLGAMIALPPLLWSSFPGSPAAVARGVFIAIVSAAFLLSCAACLVTADSISAERRDGTLGLLFLTRVRQFDVLVGKFASSGTTCLFGLLTFLPVLMIPVLGGGVTGGEVFRKGLVLLDTSFLALSAGLWASARAYERFRAIRAALLLVGALVLLPRVAGWLAPGAHIELASPLGGMLHAADRAYQVSHASYWLSLCFVQMVGWGLLLAAAASLRTRLHSTEKGTTTPAPLNPGQPAVQKTDGGETGIEPLASISAGKLAFSAAGPVGAFRSLNSSSARSPLHWLLRRQRGMKAMVWGAAGVSFLQYPFFTVFRSAFFWPGIGVGVSWSLSVVIGGISGSLLAWVASRFFVEARRSGELELLLTSPLGAQAIVSAQWEVLKRLLRWPVVVMLVPMVLQALLLLLSWRPDPSWRVYYGVSVLLGMIDTVLGVGALCRLGIWFGLRAEGPARAVLWTVGIGRGVPYALSLICSILSNALLPLLGGPFSASRWFLSSLGPRLVILALYIWLIRLAGRQALRELSEPQALGMRQIVSSLLAGSAAALRRARRWTPA